MKQARTAAEKFRRELEGRPGVVAVGHGFKRRGGELTDISSVVVFVRRKRPLSALTAAQVIPRGVDGVPTDVVQVKKVNALLPGGSPAGREQAGQVLVPAYPEKKRPCPGGYSLGHPLITAGTLGLPVVMRDGRKALLTNTHVAAPHWGGPVKAGDPILQPGPYDGGGPEDAVARLLAWAPIDPGKPNQVDGALALIDESRVDWRIEAVTPVYGKAGNGQPGDQVIKAGRTTGLTQGKISVVGAAVEVDYGAPSTGSGQAFTALFTEQLEIVSADGKAFSAGGDSGSAILSEDGQEVLGLLFAGDGVTTYANPMSLVQQALGFDIVAAPLPETIAEQLAGLAESLALVWGYDARTKTWLAYDPLAPAEVSTLKALERAKGYWVKVARDISFSYHGQGYDLAAGWNLVGWVG